MKTNNFRKNTWSAVRMRPLTDFMFALGLSTTDIAKKTGVTRTAVTVLLQKDDAQLATLDKIFGTFGYRLEIELKNNEVQVGDNQNIVVDLSGLVKTKTRTEMYGRLSFMRDKMIERGMSYKMAAELLKENGTSRTPNAIMKWFKSGNVMMSDLMNMAKILDTTIEYRFKPIENGAQETPKEDEGNVL